jgi:hypothetical protein
MNTGHGHDVAVTATGDEVATGITLNSAHNRPLSYSLDSEAGPAAEFPQRENAQPSDAAGKNNLVLQHVRSPNGRYFCRQGDGKSSGREA